MTDTIGGVYPVLEALRARGRACRRLYLAPARRGSNLKEIIELARRSGVRAERASRDRLDRLFGGPNHQGVVALFGPYQYYPWPELLRHLPSGPALLLVLDSLQDPMNLGSLMRSAEAAGAGGVIIPREKAAPVSPTVMKAAAGAGEYIPVTRVVNLVRTLEDLKKAEFWIVGTDARSEISLYELSLPSRSAFVIGGEGQGLRRLVKEKCDRLVAIPMRGRVSSLNAAVAGALVMFEYLRQMSGPGD